MAPEAPFGASPAPPRIEILGVPVACLNRGDALKAIERLASRPEPARIFFANANMLNLAWEHAGYSLMLQQADLILNDGIGISLAARVNGHRFPENLNGSDFNPHLLEIAARKGWKVFLLGGAEGVAERARRALEARIEGIRIVGTHHGYFPAEESRRIVADIRRTGAEVVIAAMGNPLQEKWLHEHLEATGARLGVAAGAFLDFQAGVEKRAPAWMNRMGVEWVYRLIRHPIRLGRRYLIGNPKFLFRIAKMRRRTTH